ncbi:jg10825 [Pararge aegeria aegeria]|uniref:Jg10825 protein n=1 Tax=Pararge aegeria aegeria TaxID=348720 RepID=A0A8S4QIJ3_9NEOP|nr:jg10825 [Pararge aegeria aegeria]
MPIHSYLDGVQVNCDKKYRCRKGVPHLSSTHQKDVYCEKLERMMEKLAHLQPALVNLSSPRLLHHNARLHTAQQTVSKLQELALEALPHLPYSPDLAPADYYFFQNLDNILWEKDISENSTLIEHAEARITGGEIPEEFENNFSYQIMDVYCYKSVFYAEWDESGVGFFHASMESSSSKIPQCLKTKVFEQCVVPLTTYGSETWSLTMGLIRRLRVSQRAMERAMLGVPLREQIRNEEIRRRTRVTVISEADVAMGGAHSSEN